MAVAAAPPTISTTSPLPSGVVGVFYEPLTLSANDGTLPYVWSITSLPPGLVASGATISGIPTAPGSYSINAQVTDSSRQTDSKTFALTIVPALTITTAALPDGVLGDPYPNTILEARGGTGPYNWRATGLPNGLSVNSGVLSGSPGIAGTFSVMVTVSDSSMPAQTMSRLLSLTINSRLTITTSTLPDGVVGQLYPGVTLEAQGGATPYSWSATGLPSAMSLTSAGVLGGMPAAAGVLNLSVTAADHSNPPQRVTKSLSITIASGLMITTSTLPDGVVGQLYPGVTLEAQGGLTPYSWSANGLPSGMSLSSAGLLGGTPTAAGTFSLAVTLADHSTPPRTVTKTISLLLKMPQLPRIALSVGAQPTTFTDQPELTVSLDRAYPFPLDARLTLSYTPDAAGVPNAGYSPPTLQFASGGTSATLSIAANNTISPIARVQLGDVAGVISVTLADLRISLGGQVLELSDPKPFATLLVPRLKPIIAPGSVRIVDLTPTGFTVEVVATSTPRDLGSATVSFAAAAGAVLNGTTFTVQLTDIATTWFASAVGQGAGGSFNLKIPFPFSGDPDAIGSVSVVLTNAVGASAPVAGAK